MANVTIEEILEGGQESLAEWVKRTQETFPSVTQSLRDMSIKNCCILLNDETLPPLAKLWGVHEESLICLSKEADAGYFEMRKVSWQRRLMEIEGELLMNLKVIPYELLEKAKAGDGEAETEMAQAFSECEFVVEVDAVNEIAEIIKSPPDVSISDHTKAFHKLGLVRKPGINISADELNGRTAVPADAPMIEKIMPFGNMCLKKILDTLASKDMDPHEQVRRVYDLFAAFGAVAAYYGRTGEVAAPPNDFDSNNNETKEN